MNAFLAELYGLWAQTAHPLTLSCAAIVLLFGLIAIVLMVLTTARAKGELNALNGPITPQSSSRPAVALDRARLRDLSDGRSLLTERPNQLLDEWLQLNVLRLARFEAGSWITGAALFFTFFLIALVLANDVGPAIAGSGKENMVSLAHAVRTMGAKFVVSMLGIFMSITHGFVRARCLHVLHNAVAEAAHRLRGAAVSVEDFQVDCAEWQVDNSAAIHRELKANHTENAKQIENMLRSVESLQSIRVSVQDIGAELGMRLQHIVKHDIVEGIRNELQDIVNGLQTALTESFSTNLSQQVTTITEELRKIEAAVSSQAHTQVDGLLQKLNDAVSGGFASESSRMKDVMARFAEAIPGLEAQMRSMSRSASEELAQRTAETSRANGQLFEQLGIVLDGMERQQQAATAASAHMQHLVGQTQNALASSLADANEQLAARSQGAMDQLAAAMRTATTNAAEVYQSMVSEVDAAAKTLQQARIDATSGASQLRESTQLMREPLLRMNDLVTGLREAVTTLGSTVQQAQGAVQSGSAVVQASAESVLQHQRFIEQLSSRWPDLAREHLESSDKAFGKVAASWKAQAESIGTSVGTISESFASSAVELAEAVQEFGEQLTKMNGNREAAKPTHGRG